ncbi:MAG TPA: protein kinase [Natronosporangium sp.]|nr:protein kinase [Natronosporangium sp.]
MTDPYSANQTFERAGPGTVVGGRYELQAAVGHGGMGTVWRAHDRQLGRRVAVKEVVPPPGIAPEDREAMYQRMLREARAAAGLSHPGIVQVYDVVTDAGRPWVVMELLDARSLSDVVLQDGPLPPRAVAKIGIALLGALEVAHAAGILHRDVKPANVLICSDGRCVLTDFGVARIPSEQQLTTPGMVLGSPHFISPERAMGKPFGPASDLFSLGVTMYAAVEGRPPFDEGDPIATMHAVVEDPPPPPERAGPLTEVLYGLLEKDPDRRWDTATARAALRRLLAGPLASNSLLYPTDPYAVVPAQRQPSRISGPSTDSPAPTAPPRRRAKVGGRAMLAPGESITDRLRRVRSGESYGTEPERSVAGSTTYEALGSTVESQTVSGEPSWESPTRPTSPAGGWVPAPRSGGRHSAPPTRSYRSEGHVGASRPRHGAPAPDGPAAWLRHWGRVAGDLAARGLEAALRLPRPVQLAAAAGLAALLLLVVVLVVVSGGDSEAPPGTDAAPVTGADADDQPLLPVQEYTGRGVRIHIPADWTAVKDDPELVYVDFVDPDDASVMVRLVVEAWSGDARGLVEVAEQSIQQSSSCPEPYQRVEITEQQVGGLTGSQLEYTCGEGDQLRRARWVTVVSDGTAYSLRLIAPDQQFADREVIYQELLRSFQLTE